MSVPQRKTNWEDFQKILYQHNITKLYHFTDRSNLKSIVECGALVSWKDAEDNGIGIAAPGGGSLSRRLDKKAGLEYYVRLSFVKDHPMMHVAQRDGRIDDPVVLEIDPQVIFFRDTKFSDINAADSEADVSDSLGFFNSLRFDMFRKGYFDYGVDKSPYYQAEVLVFHRLPICYITNISSVYNGYINPELLKTPEKKDAEAEERRLESQRRIEAQRREEEERKRREEEERRRREEEERRRKEAAKRVFLESIHLGLSKQLGGDLQDRAIIKPGGKVYLRWQAEDVDDVTADLAVSVTCDSAFGSVTLFNGRKTNGYVEVSPDGSSLYHISVLPIVDGCELNSERRIGEYEVEVREESEIAEFKTEFDYVCPNSKVQIFWNVKNADSVELVGFGKQSSKGAVSTLIVKATTFELVVKDVFGVKRLQCAVNMLPKPLDAKLQIPGIQFDGTLDVNMRIASLDQTKLVQVHISKVDVPHIENAQLMVKFDTASVSSTPKFVPLKFKMPLFKRCINAISSYVKNSFDYFSEKKLHTK